MMTESSKIVAGIMAGGNASRFSSIGRQKALAPFKDGRIIDLTIRAMVNAHISDVAIVTWPDNTTLMSYLKYMWPQVNFHLLPSPRGCGGTGQAMLSIIKWGIGKNIIISTSDTVLPTDSIVKLIHSVSFDDVSSIGLLVSKTVEDEEPIWVAIDDESNVISYSKKGKPSGIVFGNVRLLSSRGAVRVLELVEDDEHLINATSSGEIIRALIRDSRTLVTSCLVDPVFDIDRPEDLILAEERFNS